jgi:alcohol dehydrogenase
MWSYRNPVEIDFGAGSFARLPELIAGRPYALVTYAEPVFAALAARLAGLAGPPAVTLDEVAPNPDFADLPRCCRRLGEAREAPRVIVALGGGSVIDTAKALAATGDDFGRVRRFVETGSGAEELLALPIIAVPTTAGTGSEVTCWATLWHAAADKKYSLLRPSLYAEHAVIDPELLLGLPRGLTISSGLDALSHALESLWNVNANPVSRSLAVAAAREMLAALPLLVAELTDLDLRARVARAALLAGLAFSNTKTALAHSLSYPVTLRYGVAHGIACSFSLPMVMRGAIGASRACDQALQDIFGPDLEAGAERLAVSLTGLGVSPDPGDYGIDEVAWRNIVKDAFAGERGKNYIGPPERFQIGP